MRGFGDLEAVIMDRLWSGGAPATVREVLEGLAQDRKIAYTTVMTVMDNLHRKGWLTREMDGRAFRYAPSKSREEYGADLMREALADTRNADATLVHFLDGMTEEDSEALRRALRRRRRSGS